MTHQPDRSVPPTDGSSAPSASDALSDDALDVVSGGASASLMASFAASASRAGPIGGLPGLGSIGGP